MRYILESGLPVQVVENPFLEADLTPHPEREALAFRLALRRLAWWPSWSADEYTLAGRTMPPALIVQPVEPWSVDDLRALFAAANRREAQRANREDWLIEQ
jgi:hypothetical protein